MNFDDFIFQDNNDNVVLYDETIELPNGITFENLIDNGYIRISREVLDKLKDLTDRKLEFLLSFLIDKYKLNFPHSDLTLKDVEDDFYNLLKYNTSRLLTKGKCVTKVNRVDLPDYYLFNESIGRISSDYFQRDYRIKCSGVLSSSPHTKWYQSGKRTWLPNAISNLRNRGYLNESTIRIPLTKHFIASQFSPIIAKFIINKFEANKILDFSSGWGDRLCGFYASNAKEYIGIDPNLDVHEGYLKQIDFYKNIIDDKTTTFISKPSEDVDFDFGEYDMVFTSPPYFNIEKYNTDETQSYIRYKKYDDWLNNFLFKVVEKSLVGLKKDGYIILNLADSNTTNLSLCDPLFEFMKNMSVKYFGCLPFRCPNRFHAGNYDGTVVEPIFIWKKI